MTEQTELLTKILEIVTLIAEPHIAERDRKRRDALKQIVGKSLKARRAASLMDGTQQQALISKVAAIDAGALSRLTKSLREAGLLADDGKNPKLTIPLPKSFWDELETTHAE